MSGGDALLKASSEAKYTLTEKVALEEASCFYSKKLLSKTFDLM